MKDKKKLEIERYKTAIEMPELLSLLGIEQPNGSDKILCPFHEESNPSCHVYKYRLRCYGCDESWDTIALVQKAKGLNFKQAVKWIARKAGLDEPSLNGDSEKAYEERSEIIAINEYFWEIAKNQRKKARQYLKKRGIDLDEVEGVEVGYFPRDYEPDGDDKEFAEKAGLLNKSGRFLFSGKVVIPVIHHSEVVSLYGRDASDDIGLNHVYPSKTDPPMPRTLWGLDDCRHEGEVYVTESIIDALTLKSNGISNAVAAFGTSGLTEERLGLLKSSKIKTVHLVFDCDKNGSGQKAALKTGERLFRAGLVVKIISLPRPEGIEKVDINDFLRDHSIDEFQGLEQRDFFQVALDQIPVSGTPQVKFKTVRKVLKIIQSQPEPTWEEYVKLIAERCPSYKPGKLVSELKKLRKEAESEGDSKKFIPLAYVGQIQAQHNVLYHNSNFYRYESGVYEDFHIEEINRLTTELIGFDAQPYQLEAVLKFLKNQTFIRPQRVNVPGLLNLKNGLLDLASGELRAHSPEILSTVQAQVEFDPAAQWLQWQEFLDQIFPDPHDRSKPDRDKQMLLSEIFGYSLTSDTSFHLAFWLYGGGANGKSVVCNMLEALVGLDNCGALMLSDLKERFRLAELENKMVNIVSEVEANSLINDARFKSIVAGDPQTGERKNKDPFKFRPFAKWIIATNNMPATRDHSYGFERRLVILPFERTFADEDQDKGLSQRLIETELSGILNWAIGGYRRLQRNGRFTIPKASEKALEDYKEQINPTLAFVRERVKVDSKAEGIPLKSLYATYRTWCEGAGYVSVGRNKFSKEIQTILKIKTQKIRDGGLLLCGIKPIG